MADVKRPVCTKFWTDGKVDDFSPEDKYFMLYLLTSPFSRQLGIYEISIKQAAFQMGYSEECFKVLLDRFENKYKVILYSKETNEVAILNFLCHSVVSGGKPVEDCIKQDMARVKNKALIQKVFSHVRKRSDWDELNTTVKKIVTDYIKENDIHNDDDNNNDNDSTVDDSFHDSSCDSSNQSSEPEKDNEIYISIITYLNQRAGVNYRASSKKTKTCIHARIEEGFTLEDFKTVIDKKADEWIGTEYEKYLRPETLFGTKFESYLNANIRKPQASGQTYKKQTRADELNDFYAMAAQFGEGD